MVEPDAILLTRPEPHVLLVTLNRPQRYNALTFEMFDRFSGLVRAVEDDADVRCVVVTGAGRGFCGGLDLDAVGSLGAMTGPQYLRGQERWSALSVALSRVTKPVIAAVNGPAAGAGLSLALACDLRVAATPATFTAAFIRVGLTGGDMGSSWLLPRIVGLGTANELLLTGRSVDAEEALRIGLVNRVVPPDALLGEAFALARQIVANSPVGVRLTKQVIQANLGAASLELALELENRSQALAAGTAEMAEALAAMRERRDPSWVENRPVGSQHTGVSG